MSKKKKSKKTDSKKQLVEAMLFYIWETYRDRIPVDVHSATLEDPLVKEICMDIGNIVMTSCVAVTTLRHAQNTEMAGH